MRPQIGSQLVISMVVRVTGYRGRDIIIELDGKRYQFTPERLEQALVPNSVLENKDK